MIEETGWLIELSQRAANVPTWWGRIDDETVCGWTTDHAKAIRFARAVDAQAVIDDYGWTEARPVDHMWCDYSHRWEKRPELKWETCAECMMVRRADDKNGPCKGPSKLRPMERFNDDPNSELGAVGIGKVG